MEAREAIERAHEADAAGRHGAQSEKIGVVIVAVLAALLAMASVFGRRAVKDLLLYNEQEADAANIAESNDVKLRINEATILTLRVLVSDPATATSAREAVQALERESAEVLTPERERQRARAHELEEKREHATRGYESFEVAETVLQVAIVFVTIAVAVHGRRMLQAGGALGLLGLVLVLDGFFRFLPY